MKLDRTKRFTEVGGRLPLRYLQDGHGFDGAERYLGRYTDQGEPAGEPEPEAPKAPEVIRQSIDHIRPKVEGETQDDVAIADMGIKDLKTMAKEAGIKGSANMNKAALIEALES